VGYFKTASTPFLMLNFINTFTTLGGINRIDSDITIRLQFSEVFDLIELNIPEVNAYSEFLLV
jgi:hypothetical protein